MHRSRGDRTSLRIEAGGSDEVTFERRDSPVLVVENVYSWMSSWIHVFDHPWFATTGSTGTFVIDDVPVGTHTLRAWHGTFGTTGVQVEVTRDGTTDVELSFSPR